MNRYRDRIRRGIFARPYVGPSDALDTTPDPFAFDDVVDQEPGFLVLSEIVTITGIDADVSLTISTSGGVGEYSVDGGGFTASLGSIGDGSTVQLRVAASLTPGAAVAATLTIGGFAATFTVYTRDAGQLDFSDADNSALI